MSQKKSTLLVLISFFSIYVIWGSTYVFNKVVVTELPPFFLASIRFITAGILIMIISKILKLDFSISKKQLLNSTIAGFLFLVYGNGVFVWALKYIDSGFGALLASTQPLFVLLLMRLIDRKKMQKKSIIGIFLGLFGMYLLINQKDISSSESSMLGIFMVLTCVFSWSYGGIFVSKSNLPKNYFVSTGYQMLTAGGILCILSLLFNETWVSPKNWSTPVQGALLFLIIFGGIVAFTAFNYLLKYVSTEKVATFAYVNPIIAMFLGWYLLSEQITQQSIIASIVLLTGVYFITSRKRK